MSEITINILNNTINLDHKCWNCEDKDDYRKECEYCNGKGYILTAQGRSILELMKRYAKVDVSSIIL